MNKASDFTLGNLKPYLNKTVVVTYKEEGSDAQVVRGEYVGSEGSGNDLPTKLYIENESGERLKISVFDIEDFREGEPSAK